MCCGTGLLGNDCSTSPIRTCTQYMHTHRSSDFRPTFSRLHELRAVLSCGISIMALMATVTMAMRKDVIERLDMQGCLFLSASPDRPNITYRICQRTTLEEDMARCES